MTTANDKKENGKVTEVDNIAQYRDQIKKALNIAIGTAMEEENLRATKEMEEVREKAIGQITDERKAVIGKIVEDEKKAIWTKAQEVKSAGNFQAEVIKENIAKIMINEKPAESVKPVEAAPAAVKPAPVAAPAPIQNNPPAAQPAIVQPAASKPAPAPAPAAAPAPVQNTTPTAPAHVTAPVTQVNVPAAAAPAAPKAPVYEEKVELEILPPRDQKEIEAIEVYLKTLTEISSVELVTLIDKSIFKVTLQKPMDFMTKLGAIPEVHNAEEVREDGKRKIKIYLAAKIRLEKNQAEVNSKVNKIFGKKR
jgi:hypothetical protein